MDELEKFEAALIDPRTFGHEAHLRVAHAMLGRYAFLDALGHYADGLRQLTRKAGVPEKFNVTMTVAFLSVIAERMQAQPSTPWETFRTQNAELMDRAFLSRWYAPDRLRCDLARTVFLMPEGRP